MHTHIFYLLCVCVCNIWYFIWGDSAFCGPAGRYRKSSLLSGHSFLPPLSLIRKKEGQKGRGQRGAGNQKKCWSQLIHPPPPHLFSLFFQPILSVEHVSLLQVHWFQPNQYQSSKAYINNWMNQADCMSVFTFIMYITLLCILILKGATSRSINSSGRQSAILLETLAKSDLSHLQKMA